MIGVSTVSYWAPASKKPATSAFRSPMGMKPAIMTTNVKAKMTSTPFWRPVSLTSLLTSAAAAPCASSASLSSCMDRMVEPLSALTFLA